MEFFNDRRVQIPLALLLGVGIALAGVALCGGFASCGPNPEPTTTTPIPTTTTTTTITPPTGNSTDTPATTPIPTTTPTPTPTTTPTPTPTTTQTPTPTTITTTTPSPNPKSPYLNVFTLRSLQTFCKSNRDGTCYAKHPIPQENLSIEVLSTSLLEKGIILKDCGSNETFDINQFDEILIENMKQTWAAPYSDDKDKNVDFWKKEWDMYGVCTGRWIDDYFLSSLSFTSEFPISFWLSESSIYPSNNRPYFVQNFTNAIVKSGYFKENQFFLKCQTEDNQQWLNQINLCISYEDIFQPVDCDFRIRESNCDETLPIYFVQNYTAPVGGGNHLLGNLD